jgi:hypothetical protein
MEMTPMVEESGLPMAPSHESRAWNDPSSYTSCISTHVERIL